jgi:GntR family transcriptional regulator
MFTIDKLSRTPIYEQLIAQFEYGILSGEIAADGKLPSVRELSQALCVNPNTLQRAFNEIEARGLCYSVPGSGRYIAKDALERLKAGIDRSLAEFVTMTELLKARGVSEQLLKQTVETVYQSKSGKETES